MATPASVRSAPLQPSDWIRAGVAQLAREGVESVRVEVLARELGVSKGSFYWHFRDRDELLIEMLRLWENSEAEWLSMEEAGETEKGSAAIRWARFLDRSAGPEKIKQEIALRAWARRDERVALRVAHVESRKVRFLANILADVGFQPDAAESWSEMICLVYSGWLDRSARDGEFRLAGKGLGELLSELVLAASAKAATRNS